MADATKQTTRFGFQKIGDGSVSSVGTQTATTSTSAGSQELEPRDYNALLQAIDNGMDSYPGLGAGGTIAAAGTTQATATPIAHNLEWVTGANAAAGVILPAAKAGAAIFVKNDDVANAVLKVYPLGATDVINALGATNAISMAAKTSATFMCAVAGTWHTIPLVPS